MKQKEINRSEAEREFYADLLKTEIDNLSVIELKALLAFIRG